MKKIKSLDGKNVHVKCKIEMNRVKIKTICNNEHYVTSVPKRPFGE